MLSPALLESPYAAAEWAAAFREDPQGHQHKLLPVRVRDCEPDGLLGPVVYVDLVGLGEDSARERLLSEAAGHRGKPAAMPTFPGSGTRSETAGVERVALPVVGAAIWNVPTAVGRFVGRERLLEQLAERLGSAEAAAVTQVEALHGLGGVGKTRLAIELARRLRDRYDVVWWIRTEDPITRLGDYASLADALALATGEREQQERADAVKTWLDRHGRWLVVFDNASSPEAVRDLIPDASGHVLITSRQHGGWRAIAEPLAIDVWDRAESLTFLRQRTADPDQQAAEALADALGDLPLALEQAAAYIDTTSISLAGYRDRLHSHAPQLFVRGQPADYEHTIATTWELAFAELEQDPGCAAILFCCAFLAPEQIPRELFASQSIANGVFTAPDGELALDNAVRRILAFSLVTADESYLTMHRLVQHVIRNRLGDQQEYWHAISEQVITETFPAGGDDHREWPMCERLLPHALAVTDWARRAGTENPQTAALLLRVARYLFYRAQFAPAKDLHQRALEIFEEVYGPEHPQVASALTSLGIHLWELGDLAGARERHQRALEIFEEVYGPKHPEVAVALGNLGNVLEQLGELSAARELHERGLEIFEEVYGPEHPQVARTLGNLGNVLFQLGDLRGARELHERALEIFEEVYGPEHPQVASALTNLGIVLEQLGNLAAARERHERALRMIEALYGPEHPYAALALGNLGQVLAEQGDLEGARDQLLRALQIKEVVYGTEHPQVALTLGNLGNVVADLGISTSPASTSSTRCRSSRGSTGQSIQRSRSRSGISVASCRSWATCKARASANSVRNELPIAIRMPEGHDSRPVTVSEKGNSRTWLRSLVLPARDAVHECLGVCDGAPVRSSGADALETANGRPVARSRALLRRAEPFVDPGPGRDARVEAGGRDPSCERRDGEQQACPASDAEERLLERQPTAFSGEHEPSAHGVDTDVEVHGRAVEHPVRSAAADAAARRAGRFGAIGGDQRVACAALRQGL